MGSIPLVDDEQELTNMYNTFLKTSGYRSICFIDPSEALEHYEKNAEKYCLVITDLRMPGISGIDLANKIRKLNSKVKIFLLTAFETDIIDDTTKIKEARIDNVIKKPIRLLRLREMINHAIVANRKGL